MNQNEITHVYRNMNMNRDMIKCTVSGMALNKIISDFLNFMKL